MYTPYGWSQLNKYQIIDHLVTQFSGDILPIHTNGNVKILIFKDQAMSIFNATDTSDEDELSKCYKKNWPEKLSPRYSIYHMTKILIKDI